MGCDYDKSHEYTEGFNGRVAWQMNTVTQVNVKATRDVFKDSVCWWRAAVFLKDKVELLPIGNEWNV